MKNINTTEITKIIQDYSDYIKGLCHKYYIEGGTNDDLYQEGIIGLLEACKNYNGESLFEKKFEPFAKMCIKYQIFDAIRKSKNGGNEPLNNSVPFVVSVNENGDEFSLLDVLFDRTISSDPLEKFIDREKYREKMDYCKQVLTDLEKQVLNHYLAGERQSEIAKYLNKSVKSIDNTLQRIKSKLSKSK